MRPPLLLLTLLLPTAALAAEVTLEGHTLVLPTPLAFEAGTAKLTNPDALAPVVAYFEKRAMISLVRVEGHVAGAPDAHKLSGARALAVAKALVAKGVDCKRLLPVAFGDTKPVADPSTPEGKAKNTRIELVNAALRDRPIGGMPLDGGAPSAGDPCAR